MTAHIPSFASDNWAPAHPAVLDALTSANAGTVPAYGNDQHTAEALTTLRACFGERALPYLVLTGTGANVLALDACVRPYQATICADTAHVLQDETGAVERFLGSRLIGVPAPHGKLTPDSIRAQLGGRGNVSRVQPRAVSISQCTEYGTTYSAAELRELCDVAHAEGLRVHMDGARLANAAAFLGCSLSEITAGCGIDVLSLGATKNGALGAEAVIFFDPALAEEFGYRRKQGMQLASKMRYVAAQMTALFATGLWRENASHANAMARRLADGLASLPGTALTQRTEANEVFVRLPVTATDRLRNGAHFHVWNPETGEYRFVCSWSTTEAEVDGFIVHARSVLAAG